MKYKFGDMLCYTSPGTGTKIKCVFVRGNGRDAYVIFNVASRVSRVSYDSIGYAE